MQNPKLKPWLDIGLKRFARLGLSGLNVSEMADELKIAKSSFYHYFNTREEYLEQLVEYWLDEGTIRIIREILLLDHDLKSIFNLFEIVLNSNFTSECFLIQMRAAVHQVELFKEAVEEADKLRISFITSILTRVGFTPDKAAQQARQIYLYAVGIMVNCNLVEPSDQEKQMMLSDFVAQFEDALDV